MGAHILLVSERNYEICITREVYGCVQPTTEWNRAEIIAGLYSLQLDDLIFFYVKNKGIYGLWKVVSEPFYDDEAIWTDTNQLYPYRFLIGRSFGTFQNPISLSDILDLHDKGKIWTFDLNPVQQKNQYKITMDEAKELLRLLLRNNQLWQPKYDSCNTYNPQKRETIKIDFGERKNGSIKYEGWLNAWFMLSLKNGSLKKIVGDYSEFINLVPTSFNKVMDIFLTHVSYINNIPVLYKYTCIELKTEKAMEKDLTQLLHYEDWLARKLSSGDHEMIQSILVANQFSQNVIDYVLNRKSIENRVIRLLVYKMDTDNRTILLNEIL